jgi:glycerol-3-phosphate O-acyltransferase/dihydroxyacetone phosphate acyltransferase
VDASATVLYRLLRWVLRLALGFYFRRVERFHLERVPASGPVLFVSNHPNSLTDSFLIGASVPRKVNFVATVQLFRWAPLKWLLTRCGVIPINRLKDDPHAMRTVAGTFAACFRVLQAGEAVGIFPEGITYEDSQLKEIKPGAARIALEFEAAHDGKAGLHIVPVGLSYSAKERYRSDVLLHFGQPLPAADFLRGYPEHRKDAIARLTGELEKRLQHLILHLPELERQRVVAGVKRLYLDHLRVGNTVIHEPVSLRSEELLLTQRIAAVVGQVYEKEPEVASAFAARLQSYEHTLERLRISDAQVALFPKPKQLWLHTLSWSLLALVGAPVALYGWAHRAIPYLIVRWAAHRFPEPGKRKAQASTATLIAGVVAFSLFYTAYVVLFHQFFGWPVTLGYALSLPPASLLAHYYLRNLSRLAQNLRVSWILLRAPVAGRGLLAKRTELIAEIEHIRHLHA